MKATNATFTSDSAKYSAVANVVNTWVPSCTDGFDQRTGFRPLRILAPSVAQTDLNKIGDDYVAATGHQVIFEFVDPRLIVREMKFSEQTSPLTYDGWLMPGSGVVDLVTTTKLVAPIDEFISHDSSIQWSDVSEFVREISSTYGGVTVGMPIAGRPLLLMYRQDVFAAANLSTPNTWEDMVSAAQILNSTDFDGDGIMDYSMCLQLTQCFLTDGMIDVEAILATMTQTGGPRTGFLWDPETMQSLGGSAAMTRTMELIQALLPYSAIGCGRPNPMFMQGRCALTIAPDVLFKAWQVSRSTAMKSAIGTAMVPGSTRVLDRRTGRMEACTPALCPNAVYERIYDGSELLVNRAPHFGLGGFSGFVNAYQEQGIQQSMYDFWSFMAEPIYSKTLFMTPGVIGPYRRSHEDTSAASLAAWSAIGYDVRAVQNFLTTILASLEHPNFSPDLRILGGQSYLNTLQSALLNASAGMAPAQITANVLAEHTAILASSSPRDKVQQTLRAGLGIVSVTPPPPVDVNTVEALTLPATAIHSSDKNLAIILGITIPLAAVLLALLIAQLFFMRHRRRSLFGGHWVPSPGEDTTLVVTDIMDSTALWESLAPGVMECAVATHNTVVRQAQDRWNGYEQATEGDSFLLAFHNPSDALGFALQLQMNLLEAAWEPELLQHPICAPVKMGPSPALQDAGDSDGRFALLRAARVLAPPDGPFGRVSSTVSIDFGIADDDKSPHVSPNSTLAAAGSALQPHAKARRSSHNIDARATAVMARSCRGSIEQLATAAASPLYERSSLTAPNGGVGVAAEAVVMADTARSRRLDKARMLLQTLHMAATGDGAGLRKVESFESVGSGMPRGDAHVASTMAKFMRLAWTSDLGGSQAAAAVVKDQALVFKGLQVRVGMHSGVTKDDMERNTTSGAGGMVLLSQETFERLHPDRALKGVLVLAMGEHALKPDDNLGHVCLYQAIERSLVPRLAVFESLRGLSGMETSVMDAPIGTVTIAFANMVGLSTLQAWNREQADVALEAYAAVSKQLLHDAGGYLVEQTSSGLCLAAFCHPLDAVAWGAGLIEVMKHHQWDEELLDHELCEEVLLHETASSGIVQWPRSRVLFRGPRIKIGIDVGKVQADVSPVTGRMTYRGRVMNRAARISGKASSGMQWCSTSVWEQANGQFSACLLAAGIRGTQLGAFSLKGVAGDVKLVEALEKTWYAGALRGVASS
ncbi:hypothetical protein FOA52_014333 [Chlamydomonas sp. UWO 241]|nr:hypothetical protein FOA52_014333 [Chlamydomonas sp. UWO 241]